MLFRRKIRLWGALALIIAIMGGVWILELNWQDPRDEAGFESNLAPRPQSDALTTFTAANRETETPSSMSNGVEIAGADSFVQEAVDRVVTSRPVYPPDSSIQRNGNRVKILNSETLEENVRYLEDLEWYKWPGGVSKMALMITEVQPLPADIGSEEFSLIFGNRRFLKVVQELGKLPKSKAESLLNEEFRQVLDRYRQAYREDTASVMANDHSWGFIDFKYAIKNNDEHSVSLPGDRYKIFSLSLIAGNLELGALSPLLSEIVTEAQAQRDSLYDYGTQQADSAEMCFRNYWIANWSLYNRQILATSLLGSTMGLEKARVFLEQRNIGISEVELPAYDAAATPYDIPVRSLAYPPDRSKQGIHIWYVNRISDEQFDELVSSCQGRPPDSR